MKKNKPKDYEPYTMTPKEKEIKEKFNELLQHPLIVAKFGNYKFSNKSVIRGGTASNKIHFFTHSIKHNDGSVENGDRVSVPIEYFQNPMSNSNHLLKIFKEMKTLKILVNKV